MLVAITKKEKEWIVAHFNPNLIKISEKYWNFILKVFEEEEVNFLRNWKLEKVQSFLEREWENSSNN